MKLQSIKIKNIRSFREEVEFNPRGDFNVLIGPNGSGKSNLFDIVYITLRHFFVNPYHFSKERRDGGFVFHLNRDVQPFGVITNLLSKYAGDDMPRQMMVRLQVTKADIDNMASVLRHKDLLAQTMTGYSLSYNTPRDFLNAQPVPLNEGEVFEYQINEINLVYPNEERARYYLNYLQSIEGLSFVAREEGFGLIPLILYISPFRGVESASLEVSLSSMYYHDERTNVTRSTSRSTSSLIQLASLFFSEKRRRFESRPDGYQQAWRNDPDVQFVTDSLATIGYTWDIQIVDSNKNTYIIQLKKDGRAFLLNEASSGEIELINFILGLITLDLDGGLIIIDEPELHLHPQWLAILRDFFLKFANEKHNQLMVSTHSATFISTSTFPYISRVYKDSNGYSKIHQVNVAIGEGNKERLHFFNATNNEKVFFSDFVIMVEGDTDEIIFKKILDDLKTQTHFKSLVEIMQVGGKTNYDSFSRFLATLNIPCAYIGDVDNVNQMAEGKPEIESMLVKNSQRIARLVIKNPGAKDNEGLVNCLEKAINTGDLESLKSFYEYIVSFRTKIRPDLTPEEQATLHEFIESQKHKNIFILSDGEIEAYFLEGFRNKDLDNVLRLTTSDVYEKWKTEEGYKKLESIVLSILKQNNIIN